MNKPILKTPAGKKPKYCSFCDFTGILRDPHHEVLGKQPLTPCPKCVLPICKCGGISPYYYSENGNIKECACRGIGMKIDRINLTYSRSGIDKKYKWRFINNFKVRDTMTEKAKNAAYDVISKFPNVDKGLYLWGNPGTGKTLLSAIILTEIMTRHAIDGKFVKISRNFFNRIRSTFYEGSPTYGEASAIEREFAEAPVLVIDDFGVQRDSAWELETLYNLVDARYEALKFTIFTSNSDPFKTLKDKSEGRILSRIKEMCRIIELSGTDFRDNL